MNLRGRLCSSANIKFQRLSEREDLLNLTITRVELVRCLYDITRHYAVMLTSVVTDHSNDRVLGTHCHANGWCADLWPIYIAHGNWTYIDANSPDMREFLAVCKNAMYIHEIGLAGAAYSLENVQAASGGDCTDVFRDDGGDHIHIGTA